MIIIGRVENWLERRFVFAFSWPGWFTVRIKGIEAAFARNHSGEGIVVGRCRSIKVDELGILSDKFKLHAAYGAVPVFRDNNFTHTLCRHPLFIDGYLIIFRTVQEHNDVGILFDRARFAKIR